MFGAHRLSGIKINAKKTKLFQARVDYVGFKISELGVRLPEKAVKDILDWPAPTSAKEVGTMLGFIWVL